ncbi:MAG TPA: TrbG/VirB9 family P-type conjugative transfer protein [Candidatus Dormibacteraeota bacterium]|nr:TrbG/VirB9 family P-type conjugative transfer protein [Candidatus Dormibacteraeota bacterium]
MHTLLKSVLKGTLAMVSFTVLAMPPAPAESTSGRTVKYSQQDIISIRAKIRFSTLIVLPVNEDILDFATGDKEFWIINGTHNLCYVHPAKAGIRSDLHLVTSTGRVYSFLLTEVSNDASGEPDLKIFVEPKEESAIRGSAGLENYVRAGEAEAYKKELDALRAETDSQIHSAEARAEGEVARFRAEYPKKLLFDYELAKKASDDPFRVSMIYHDETFTYIKCAAREKPALYEIKDGKPNLLNFQLENGVYIAPKVIDDGYLVVGNRKVTFRRRR